MTYHDAQHLIPHEPPNDGGGDPTPREAFIERMIAEHARGEHDDDGGIPGDCPECAAAEDARIAAVRQHARGNAVTRWLLSSSSDPMALRVVDGTGPFEGAGPHYSRRTPGSRTFTGVGKEVVLITECGRAVWACVYQKTPSARGTGNSRRRQGATDARPRFLWRNMLFRNLGAGLSSDLIIEATEATYRHWRARYGSLPQERLRTEIAIDKVRSSNPGYCYIMAGWTRDRIVRGKLYLLAPERSQ